MTITAVERSRSATKKGPGRMHSRPQKRRNDKATGIPESLRRYAQQYGVDAITVAQIRLQSGEGKRVGERKDKVPA